MALTLIMHSKLLGLLSTLKRKELLLSKASCRNRKYRCGKKKNKQTQTSAKKKKIPTVMRVLQRGQMKEPPMAKALTICVMK